jgi:hypothetical protein
VQAREHRRRQLRHLLQRPKRRMQTASVQESMCATGVLHDCIIPKSDRSRVCSISDLARDSSSRLRRASSFCNSISEPLVVFPCSCNRQRQASAPARQRLGGSMQLLLLQIYKKTTPLQSSSMTLADLNNPKPKLCFPPSRCATICGNQRTDIRRG